jgi:hypothetical protein
MFLVQCEVRQNIQLKMMFGFVNPKGPYAAIGRQSVVPHYAAQR